jgi:inner membrane protein
MRLKSRGIGKRGYLIAGIAGAVAPDMDLLYFFLIDNRQHHHHSYWTHYPSVWVFLMLVSLILCYSKKWREKASLIVLFTLNATIHMVLDSLAGVIYWLAPFDDKAYSVVRVSARFEPWWLNFIVHWTFVVEIAIVAWVILVWRLFRADRVCTDRY